jgi:hypothetical protein
MIPPFFFNPAAAVAASDGQNQTKTSHFTSVISSFFKANYQIHNNYKNPEKIIIL